MSFDFDGVSIDLLFARLAENIVPDNLNTIILEDGVLTGLDDATEKSLNGPRVTLMVAKLVGDSAFPNFLKVLRCIRRWAKRKGLYGNKLGYLGGVNCNILVAFVCQLYPKASFSTLLARFFKVFADWKWPKPVQLNSIQPNPPNLHGKQRNVWADFSNPHHLMPIITPAYPAANSSDKVTKHTLAVMQEELIRANGIVRNIIAERETAVGGNFVIDWARLFEPSDFFLRYSHYLACNIVGTGEDYESRSWIGFVESRILGFSRYLERLPLKYPIHFYPTRSKTEKSANSVCYFFGFDVDVKLVPKGEGIHIDHCALQFQ